MLSAEYTAGFLDGEGSFQYYPGKASSRSTQRSVQAGSTYLPILLELQETWGGKVYEVKPHSKLTKKPAWKWIIGDAATMIPFLETIIPHLREKRGQAEVLLAAARQAQSRAHYKPRAIRSVRRVS